MQAVLTPNCLRVDMSIEECMRASAGHPVGSRINPLNSDAKIEVFGLEQTSDPKLIERVEAGRAIAQILSNDDLVLYVPTICFKDVRFSHVDFTGDDIASRVDSEHLEAWRQRIPDQTISLVFEGSLKQFDVGNYYEDLV